MEKNDIKKALYKEKPVAKLVEKLENGDLIYQTILENKYTVNFIVPKEETVDADGKYLFEDEMDAKLMIRWIK